MLPSRQAMRSRQYLLWPRRQAICCCSAAYACRQGLVNVCHGPCMAGSRMSDVATLPPLCLQAVGVTDSGGAWDGQLDGEEQQGQPPLSLEHSAPWPRRVYILMGGAGAERDRSIASGINAFLALDSLEGYQVTALGPGPQQRQDLQAAAGPVLALHIALSALPSVASHLCFWSFSLQNSGPGQQQHLQGAAPSMLLLHCFGQPPCWWSLGVQAVGPGRQ